MSLNAGGDAPYSPLIASLIDAFEASGRSKAVLPDGRRAEVASLLTRVMADPDALNAYTTSLEAARRRRGPATEMKLLGMDGLDIPDARIAAEGFDGLSDDHLADIALSPETLQALKESLDDPATEPGAWFIDAVLEAEARRPDAAEQARRAVEGYRRLKAAGLLESQDPTSALSGRWSGSERGLRTLRWGARFAALAASLLVGIVLGSQGFQGGRDGAEILVAEASPVYGDMRGSGGSGRPSRIEMRSSLGGYATVIALSPGRTAEIYPKPGAEDIAVSASVPRPYGPLAPGTTRVLFVVTETPAAETIHKALPRKTYGPEDLDRLRADLTTTLRAKGFRRMALGDAAFRTDAE